MAFKGLLASDALVMLLLSMRFPSFPVPVLAVLKFRMPPAGSVVDPLIVQYFTVLEVASLINRMVEVPAVEAVLVLVITRSLDEPDALTLPSMVTLSAPLRSIRGIALVPVTLMPVRVG